MRLLVINFEMDRLSRALPWSQHVVNLLAQKCEQVVVLTSHIGSYEQPANVYIEKIPARPYGIPQRVGGGFLVNLQAFQLIRKYRLDACFIHMAADWAYLLRPAFRLTGIPSLLWFAHGVITPKTERDVRAADRVVTSSPEGCRVDANNIRIIGQGIDTDTFVLPPLTNERNAIIAVNRISPRKRIDLLIEVMRTIKQIAGAPELHLKLVGTTAAERDQPYEHTLREQVWDGGLENQVQMVGYVPQKYIPRLYEEAFLHLNVSQTGSMDKTLLEALACGCPVLTSNEAFFDLLKDYPEFIIREETAEAIARQVIDLYQRRHSFDRVALRNLIAGHHDSRSYADKIMAQLDELVVARRK